MFFPSGPTGFKRLGVLCIGTRSRRGSIFENAGGGFGVVLHVCFCLLFFLYFFPKALDVF